MFWEFDISPRSALAAPSSSQEIHVLSIVIMTCSILSAVGAGWVLLSFACFKGLRSFRHQLILGLAFSDMVMAINFMSSAVMNLHGKDIGFPEQQGFCSYNGFMTQVFVVQTDYWVLTIAICTFFILADYKHASSWAQDHIYIVSGIPWALSILWAVIGLLTAGYGDIGAWCWFTSDEVRLLVNFIPRWIIIVIMLVMYIRLYMVLFRVHGFMSSTEDSSRQDGSAPAPAFVDGNGHRVYGGRRTQAPTSIKKLKRLARLMIMYPVAYMVIWILPTSIRIYQAITGKPAPFALQTVDKSCIVIQGVVDAIIYGINESSLSAWRKLFASLFRDSQADESLHMSTSTAHQHAHDYEKGNSNSLDDTASTTHFVRNLSDLELAELSSPYGDRHRMQTPKRNTIQKTVEVRVGYGKADRTLE